MTLSIIAAINQKRGIGYQNKLLYWLPNDLKRFKALTTGHTIIMGRHTFESLPKGALPNRRNVVLSRQELHFEGAECFHTLADALHTCKEDEEVFIIGGATLYTEALPLADRLYLTEVDDDGMEYQRGMKAITIPAHDQPGCRDVLVRCIKFVVPEDLDVSGVPGAMCNPRNFRVRFIAHNIDTDYRCCESALTL